MAITWTTGELQNLTVQWLHAKATLNVNQQKEFLSARFTAELVRSTGLNTYFDNFSLTKNLANDKTLGNYIIYMPISAGTSEWPVFGALTDCHIAKAHLVPQADIIGTDSNPIQLILRNVDTDTIICTKTFVLGNNATAYQVTSFGGVDDVAKELYAGNGVRLEKSGTDDLPDITLIIEWNLS